MGDIALLVEEETIAGIDQFLNFIHAVRDAKKGNEDAINLFKYLDLDYEHLHVIALFGLLMSRAPLEIDQRQALKSLLEIGAM